MFSPDWAPWGHVSTDVSLYRRQRAFILLPSNLTRTSTTNSSFLMLLPGVFFSPKISSTDKWTFLCAQSRGAAVTLTSLGGHKIYTRTDAKS